MGNLLDNISTLVGLMRQAAQDAGPGVSYFEHILVCMNSMAEATVQTLPVGNCVVCCIALDIEFLDENHTCW